MGRHGERPEETQIIPRITDADDETTVMAKADQTTVIPKVDATPATPAVDETTVIPRVEDEAAGTRRPSPRPVATDPPVLPGAIGPPVLPGATDPPVQPGSDGAAAESDGDKPTKGERVVKLRPEKTDEGYRSVYAALTRTTVGSVVRTGVRTTGELLITFGLVVLLFAAYEIWGKAAIVAGEQNKLEQQIAQDWDNGDKPLPPPDAGPPPPGNVVARVYVPALKKKAVVVEGVSLKDIKFAPGHYPGTAMPGQKGNFSIAWHRDQVLHADDIKKDQYIVVETQTMFYVYKVTENIIVKPTAVDVVAPVPGKPGKAPADDGFYFTMTTCNPIWDNYERLVVHAKLDRPGQPRSQGKPAEAGDF